MSDDFLTVAEVAAILKLNQQTVRNWIDAGTLAAIHVGRGVRIKRADFDALVGGAPAVAPSGADLGYTAHDFWDGVVPSDSPAITDEPKSG